MASFNPTLLLLLLLLSSLFLSVSARPCKTLFISSNSFSIKPLFPNPNNPNPAFVAVVTEISTSSDAPHLFMNHDSAPLRHKHSPHHQSLFGFSYDVSSLRERSKDILSVVVALLFGVGCGALTAATMYLLWTMFADRYEFYDDVEDEKEELKKIGYVNIPSSDPVKETNVDWLKEVDTTNADAHR